MHGRAAAAFVSMMSMVLTLAIACGGCGSRARSRCERACARMSECGRELQLEQGIDYGECVEECGKLEREPTMEAAVEKHVRCVDEAPICAQVIDCP